MSLNRELAKQAKKHGICEDWYLELKNETNIDKMLEMYIKGIDFCLSNDYPSNRFIKDNFVGKMEKHGIYLDNDIKLLNVPKIVSLGTTKGTLEYDSYNLAQIFVKHNSEIVIVAKNNSFVMVDIFDNSKVAVFASENAKVCINRYGNAVFEESTSENAIVKIIEKRKKTY